MPAKALLALYHVLHRILKCKKPIVTTNGEDIVLTEVVNIVCFIWRTDGLTTGKHFPSK